jgi:hypothetical protein
MAEEKRRPAVPFHRALKHKSSPKLKHVAREAGGIKYRQLPPRSLLKRRSPLSVTLPPENVFIERVVSVDSGRAAGQDSLPRCPSFVIS